MNTARLISLTLCALTLITCSIWSAPASAETQSQADVRWNDDPPRWEWIEGPTPLEDVPLEAALIFEVNFQPGDASISPEEALEYISITVVPEGETDPVEGTLHYLERRFYTPDAWESRLIWRATAPLGAGRGHHVFLHANNGAMAEFFNLNNGHVNIDAEAFFTTTTEALGELSMDAAFGFELAEQEQLSTDCCPGGMRICEAAQCIQCWDVFAYSIAATATLEHAVDPRMLPYIEYVVEAQPGGLIDAFPLHADDINDGIIEFERVLSGSAPEYCLTVTLFDHLRDESMLLVERCESDETVVTVEHTMSPYSEMQCEDDPAHPPIDSDVSIADPDPDADMANAGQDADVGRPSGGVEEPVVVQVDGSACACIVSRDAPAAPPWAGASLLLFGLVAWRARRS